MKKYYVSPLTGDAVLSRYSNDFYQQVLQEEGYLFVDSNAKSIVEMLSIITSRDQVHIEISVGRKKEADLLLLMLNAKYKHISITLHNPPRIKYPFFEFKNTLLNNLSKIYDRYTNNFGAAEKIYRQIQSIYVLSREGVQQLQRKYKIDNVHYLPYDAGQREVGQNLDIYSNVVGFDPNGGKKEIGQWLQLHKQLMAHDNKTGKRPTAETAPLQYKD